MSEQRENFQRDHAANEKASQKWRDELDSRLSYIPPNGMPKKHNDDVLIIMQVVAVLFTTSCAVMLVLYPEWIVGVGVVLLMGYSFVRLALLVLASLCIR